ncbi:hypothetical protein [Rubritalea tangerina]
MKMDPQSEFVRAGDLFWGVVEGKKRGRFLLCERSFTVISIEFPP